jgi:hypothetical protein
MWVSQSPVEKMPGSKILGCGVDADWALPCCEVAKVAAKMIARKKESFSSFNFNHPMNIAANPTRAWRCIAYTSGPIGFAAFRHGYFRVPEEHG